MLRKFLFFIILFFSQIVFATGNIAYTLNGSSTLSKCNNVEIINDVRGIILRIEEDNLEDNYYGLTRKITKKLDCIEYFLAKINNPVIIEVHTRKFPPNLGIKNWEFSSVIASNIGDYLLNSHAGISADRILPVGFGEYMPDINTPNNGGKYSDRIDIIILYNVNGE